MNKNPCINFRQNELLLSFRNQEGKGNNDNGSPSGFRRWNMTEAQRNAIMDYRRDGLGYKKISQLTGICESTVKTFCQRNGLTGDTANKEEIRETSEKVCLCCGKPVVQYPGRKEKKFCLDSCRNRWWNSHLHLVKRKAMYEFTCPTCGKPCGILPSVKMWSSLPSFFREHRKR